MQLRLIINKLEEEMRHSEHCIAIKSEELEDIDELIKTKLKNKDELTRIVEDKQRMHQGIENDIIEKQICIGKYCLRDNLVYFEGEDWLRSWFIRYIEFHSYREISRRDDGNYR